MWSAASAPLLDQSTPPPAYGRKNKLRRVATVFVVCLLAVLGAITVRWFTSDGTADTLASASVPLLARPNPIAAAGAVVELGEVRFTMLTDQLIRLEYAAAGNFRDNATLAFIHRNLPVPRYTVEQEGDWYIIKTSNVTVRYLSTSPGPLTSVNLEVFVEVQGDRIRWDPSQDFHPKNLLGTVRTLDNVAGSLELDCAKQPRRDLHCSYGLLSRDGLVVIDDSWTTEFTPDDWFQPPSVPNGSSNGSSCAVDAKGREDCGFPTISQAECSARGCCWSPLQERNGIPWCFYPEGVRQDWYLFGHGRSYSKALFDFTLVSGSIPLPPRYSFGVFYSRYWAYADYDLRKVVDEYVTHSVPLDVLVTDMDWHKTMYKTGGGWTGFSWDPLLFPDPSGFLEWCKRRGLKNTLNLHPAEGVKAYEDRYPEFAAALGFDSALNQTIQFDMGNATYMRTFFDIMLSPLERQGIDFWWLDWQQGEDGWTRIANLNPTFLLNHAFTHNPIHWSNGYRPFILHRWGGLGNHRYQSGFSGDVVPSFDSLAFQVYFTATASNVAFGYWSHDIGGHTEPTPSELYTRWVQFGVFSPVFRTHCTKDASNDRRVWTYPLDYFTVMREYIVLRARLLPYAYSMGRIAHDSGVSIIRPLYYHWPEASESYQYSGQYMYGQNLMVAPVTKPMASDIQQTLQHDVWIPDGNWVNWFTGELIQGPTLLKGRGYTLDELPLFVTGGSIIATKAETKGLEVLGRAQETPSALQLLVFMGGVRGGSGAWYDDDGLSSAYLQGDSAWTTASYQYDPTKRTVTISVNKPDGHFADLPSERYYSLRLPNVWPATAVGVNGVQLRYAPMDVVEDGQKAAWGYDGSSLSLLINAGLQSTSQTFSVEVVFEQPLKDPLLEVGFAGRLKRFQQAKVLLDYQWGVDTVFQEDYPNLLLAAAAGDRISSNPVAARAELQRFEMYISNAVKEVEDLAVHETVKKQLLALIM
eukprot:GILK01011856.1.p1 GENE.GILK01011856.1~~GILK01011856.1.p1  ORF type:complete len:977 (-),score=160.12 GILK01011856.1:248-3178(-)